MRYSKKRNTRKTKLKKKKSKKGGSAPALARRGLGTIGRMAMRGGPLRPNINPDTAIKKATNTLQGAYSLTRKYKELQGQVRNRRSAYNPNVTIASVPQSIPPITQKNLNILNLQGRILKDYTEDCDECLPVKKNELVIIPFNKIVYINNVKKIQIQKENGDLVMVPRDIVEII